MNDLRAVELLIIKNKPVECECCNGKMFYQSGGVYKCQDCGNEQMDDFGKVKWFLDENGPCTSMMISKATGVQKDIIDFFLKRGRVEMPEGSKYYIKCERCGCALRYGRMCMSCAKELTNGLALAFNEDIGERPKFERNSDMVGRMHYFNKKRKF